MAKTYTAKQNKVFKQAIDGVRGVKVPTRGELLQQANDWLSSLRKGKPTKLDVLTRWMMGSDDELIGISDEYLPEDHAEWFGIKTYGELVR